MLNLFKTRTQICLCFPKKRESESFHRFKTLSSVKFVIMAVENCDTPPPPRSASFSIERFLFYRYVRSFVFLLNPHRKRCICQDHVISPTFPSLPECHHTFIIACNSHPEDVIRIWQILSQEPPTEKKPGEIRTITWWLFLSLAKFYLKTDKYLFISNFSRGLSGY